MSVDTACAYSLSLPRINATSADRCVADVLTTTITFLWKYPHRPKRKSLNSQSHYWQSTIPPCVSSYLRITLEDGKQSFVDGEERRVVGGRSQVVEGHGLERAQGQHHVVGVADDALALAQH